MKKAYWVCIFEKINNTEKLKEYAIKAKPAIEKFTGKFLARGGKSRTNEGIESPRVVVVEFPDYETAIIEGATFIRVGSKIFGERSN